MKLIVTKEPYLTKEQIRKIFLALSIMTIGLYIVAMIFSLCGSTYFILNYQNAQMDRIEAFLTKYNIYHLAMWFFSTLEFTVCVWFILHKRPKWYYIATFYILPVICFYTIPNFPSTAFTIFEISTFFGLPFLNCAIDKEPITKKKAFKFIIKAVIASAVTFILQFFIFVIKAGYFSVENHVMNLIGTMS